jgi:hypothetical protein
VGVWCWPVLSPEKFRNHEGGQIPIRACLSVFVLKLSGRAWPPSSGFLIRGIETQPKLGASGGDDKALPALAHDNVRKTCRLQGQPHPPAGLA